MRLPEFPLPDGFASADDYLSYLAHRGLRDRYSTVTEEITDRLNYELKVISDMGFAGYFLIVWDLARHAKTIDLPMGPGRGSAAGCIVSYLLKITELDPIRYGLVFERFLNPDRISMPDVDVDMSAVRREEMIDYAKQKYGEDHVAQIITFSQIRSRNAIRDTARVMGYEWTFGDKIAKVLPPLVMGRETTLAECFDPNSDGFKKAEELRNMYYASSDVATVIDTARKLEGIHRSDGVHAAAVVISDVPITDVVPVQKKPKTALVTQYDMHGVEDLGLLKMDFLGLNNLDIIASTLAQLKKRGISLDINSIPKDDPETFKLMQRGETIGVFQLESIGMRNLLRRLRPNMFEDIAAVVALYRPGPMGTNMHNDYADRKNGRQASIAFHPDAEEVLGKTYSLMIYQEQVMQLAQIFAGYTLAEADQLRKVMGKKLAAAMEAEGQKFVQGCLNKGYTEELATQLFDSIDYFSGYAFNACLTGDTVIQLGAANQYFDGKITIGELFRRANTVGSGSSGDCLWCGKKAVKKQLCSGCAAWHQKFNSGKITTLSLDNDGRIRPKPIKTIYNNGVKDVWKIKLANGSEITATANHKHLSDHGWITVENLKIGDILITHEGADKTTGMSNFDRRLTSGDRQEFGKVSGAFGNDNYGYVDGGFTEFKENSQKLPAQCANDQSHTGRLEIAHLNGDRKDNQLSNLKRLCVSCHKKHDYAFNGRKKRFDKGHLAGESQIVEIIYAGKQQTYDLEMDDPGHNFIANGIVTHNSHAYSYGFIAYQTAYLKAHYPLEYMAALCSHANPLSRVAQFANEVTRMGFQVLQPSINKSDEKFTIDINDDKRLGVRIGLEIISGIGAAEARKILDERVNGDFTSVYSLVQRTNISSSTLAALANSGALDEFGHTRFGIATTAKDITAAAKKGSKKKSEPLALFDNTDFISLNIPSAEYPLSEFLTLERETTGIYISGHPLNGYIFNTEDTLSDIIESGPGTEITVSCIVSDLEKKFTKAGAAMATCKLSDNTGVLDAVMFSRTYQKMGGLLENNAGFEVQLKCSTDRMQDKTSYIIDCLSPLQPILEPLGPSKEYKIMVPKDFLKSVPDMSNFKNILLRHRGDLEVVIHLAGSSTVNRMKEMFNVAATEELESELTTLFCDFASR
jgi:DNA polymerase III alpha subunit